MITLNDAKEIEMILRSRLKPGEDEVACIERLIQEHRVATYDERRDEYAREQAKKLKQVFFAACLSQPDQTLKIDPRAMHIVDGPNSNEFELVETDDVVMNLKVYRCARRRPAGSNYFTQYDIDQLEKRR